jgi:hypothetical protein
MDNIIQTLVNDLKPRPVLTAQRLWKYCTICLAVVAAVILSTLGLRPDYNETMAMFWKPAMFFIAWLGTLLIIPAVARPGHRPKPVYYAFFAVAACMLAIVAITQFASGSATTLAVDESPLYCIGVIGVGGMASMLMIWRYWIGKAAPESPALLGLLTGLSAGFLVATAYSLHCDHDAALYILAFYLPPIALLGLGGAVAGKRLLQW